METIRKRPAVNRVQLASEAVTWKDFPLNDSGKQSPGPCPTLPPSVSCISVSQAIIMLRLA